tara:strand:- start:20 stop:976 length:957 start_codon:yes stop_codon:yes gene_type:complete
MSNFTTFFPSAGGGGGAGSGINSYAPFKVGVADNNPQGYIHSTGLYTNPIDSSVWLKTGNQIEDTTSAYPNAFSNPGLFSQESATDTISLNVQSIVWDGTHFYGANANQIHQYNSSFTATGVAFNLPSPWQSYENTTAMAFDPVNNIMILANNNGGQLFSYNHVGGSSSAWTWREEQSNGGGNNMGLAYVGGGNFLINGAIGGGRFRQTTSIGTTPSGFNNGSLPASKQIIRAGIFVYAQDTGVWREYDNAPGLASTGRTFAHTGTGTRGPALDGNGSIRQQNSGIVYEFSPGGPEVGDSTARTDSSGSAQPLFIKLK